MGKIALVMISRETVRGHVRFKVLHFFYLFFVYCSLLPGSFLCLFFYFFLHPFCSLLRTCLPTVISMSPSRSHVRIPYIPDPHFLTTTPFPEGRVSYSCPCDSGK